jgi:hypothetical protein
MADASMLGIKILDHVVIASGTLEFHELSLVSPRQGANSRVTPSCA